MADRKLSLYKGLAIFSGLDVIIRAVRCMPIPLTFTYNIRRRGHGSQEFDRTEIGDAANDQTKPNQIRQNLLNSRMQKANMC